MNGTPLNPVLEMAEVSVGSLRDPAATVMIGDTSFDMAMARSAGVNAIGVSWGYHPHEDLRKAGAKIIVDSFADLLHQLDAPHA